MKAGARDSPVSHGQAPRVLFFEPQHGGHHPSFVRMLAGEFGRADPPFMPVFAVTEPLVERLRAEDGFDLPASRGAEVVLIPRSAAAECERGSLVDRGMARWRLLQRSVDEARAVHATAPFFDPLQLPLALGRRLRGGGSLSGILFRPSIHGIYTATGARSFGERVRDVRKRALYAMMFRNSSLSLLLTLDPLFPDYARRHLHRGDRVQVIADPAIRPPESAAGTIGADVAEAFDTERVVYAMFGALTERKGAVQALTALGLLDPAVRSRVRVVFAGEVEPCLRPALGAATGELRRSGADPECWRVIDRRLTTAELAHVVSSADVVLAPYQRFVGSSGVLTWAAAYTKPVIAQDYGLIGALVAQYSLGVATDTTDPRRLRDALSECSSPAAVAALRARARFDPFLAGRSEHDFASTYARALRDVLTRERRIGDA